jgi:hypothetical protein
MNTLRSKEQSMKLKIASVLLAIAAITASPARAHGELSAASALSTLPLASVVVGASAATGAVIALPVALSATGAVLVVRAVEVSAHSTVYVLERASDGAQASVEVLSRTGHAASLAVGTAVTVSVIGAGVVLSAAGEAIAFIPNALGRALLHNERLTY